MAVRGLRVSDGYAIMLDNSGHGICQQRRDCQQNMHDSFDLPMAYIRQLLSISVRWGVAAEVLLSGSGLTQAEVERPDARITARRAGRITRRLIRLSGREDIGMEYGMLIRPTTHGFLGYAVMSCATLAEALQVVHKYLALHLKDFTITRETKGQEVIITATENYNFGPMRQVFFEALLVASTQHVAFLVGRQLEDWEVKVDWPRPAYFDAYEDRLPGWAFRQAHNQIRFPRYYLSLPLVMADPIALQHALAQVEKEAVVLAAATSPDIVPRVRALLEPDAGGYPNLGDVAAGLCVSERTLKRKLNEAGTNFQALLDEARQRRAIELIREGKLSLQQIAQVLGYTDPAAFTRAFKRWTGERPSDFRRGPA